MSEVFRFNVILEQAHAMMVRSCVCRVLCNEFNVLLNLKVDVFIEIHGHKSKSPRKKQPLIGARGVGSQLPYYSGEHDFAF